MIAVDAVESGTTPKAIVIVLGWLGAQPRHLRKYSKLYQDRHCSTVCGTADVVPIMLIQKTPLTEFGLEVAQEALKLLKTSQEDNKNIPVIIHCFSGGGCVVLDQLEGLIRQARDAKTTKTALQNDLVLLGEAIHRGGEVFDSCPAYLYISRGLSAIGLAVPNRILRTVIQLVFLLYTVVHMVLGNNHGVEHWKHLEDGDIANRQAYVYSSADPVTDSVKLDEFIEHRKQRTGSRIFVKKFDDSKHCQHLPKHPKEYQALLDEFFASIQEQQKEEEILDMDPDMTDYQLEMD